MKVLVCIPCLLTGGTEIQTLSLVQALVAAGHDPHVACYFEYSDDMVSRYRAEGAKVHLLSAAGVRPVGPYAVGRHLYQGLKGLVREVKPDVAHIQYMAPGAIPIIMLRLLGVKKIVATAHTAADIYSVNGLKLVRWLSRNLLNSFQCITESAERSFFGNARLFDTNQRLNKRGNHFTIYNNLPSYIVRRDSVRNFGDTLTVGVVSRLERIKGMDLVIPAFSKAVASIDGSDNSRVRLLIVGDGSLRAQMEGQGVQYGISEKVEFAGRKSQKELQDYYDRIDILLMPSRSEGFGLTAVEGMARGCVPVVSATGGLPEVVRDGVDGLLHRNEDIDDMAEKIAMLLRDRALLKALSESSLKRSYSFTQESYNRRIADWYKGVALL